MARNLKTNNTERYQDQPGERPMATTRNPEKKTTVSSQDAKIFKQMAKTNTVPVPAQQKEQTLSSYIGYVPTSNAEAKAIATDEIRKDEVMKEQSAIQRRRIMQAQADKEKAAAYEAALGQSRQANRRKESEQNARFAKAYNASARAEADKAVADQNRQAAERKTVKRNQMDESQEGRPGGSYNNTKGVLKQGFDSVKLGKEMGGKKTSGDEVWYSKPKTSEPKQEEKKKPNWYTGNTSYKSGQKIGTVKKKGN